MLNWGLDWEFIIIQSEKNLGINPASNTFDDDNSSRKRKQGYTYRDTTYNIQGLESESRNYQLISCYFTHFTDNYWGSSGSERRLLAPNFA